jgi:hypothetical protein
MLEGGRQRREAGVDLDHRVTAAQPSRVCGSAAREERRRPDNGHQDVIAAFVSALPCPLWWRQGVGGAAEDAGSDLGDNGYLIFILSMKLFGTP